jgi:glutaredoxin
MTLFLWIKGKTMSTPTLELYKYDSCPFCQRVMRLVDSLNLKVEMRDIMHSQENLQKLVSDTGKRTVPCLYIDSKPMFESSDIMAWLQENSDNLLKNS